MSSKRTLLRTVSSGKYEIQTTSIDLSQVFNNDLEFSLLADSGSTRKSFSGKQCACLSILQFFLFSLFFVLPGLPFHIVL